MSSKFSMWCSSHGQTCPERWAKQISEDIEAASGELLVDIPEPGTPMAKLLLANRELKRMVDELRGKAEDLAVENSSRRARVADAVEALRDVFALRPNCNTIGDAVDDAIDHFNRTRQAIEAFKQATIRAGEKRDCMRNALEEIINERNDGANQGEIVDRILNIAHTAFARHGGI
jgi:hypothetical protein